MTHPFTRTLLAVSGSMGLAIGTGILFLPRLTHAPLWRAAVTPLASMRMSSKVARSVAKPS